MMKLLNTGKPYECLKIGLLTCRQRVIDEVLDLSDLADLIPKYFIELENQNFLLKVRRQKRMMKIDWKSGIMFLWNIIAMIPVN